MKDEFMKQQETLLEKYGPCHGVQECPYDPVQTEKIIVLKEVLDPSGKLVTHIYHLKSGPLTDAFLEQNIEPCSANDILRHFQEPEMEMVEMSIEPNLTRNDDKTDDLPW